jgi:alkylation response protein AidB-like acyl-CoA dehydrogenase
MEFEWGAVLCLEKTRAAAAGGQRYAMERFYRDVRLFRIYEGTSQIQQLVIARNMIREPRE